MEERARSSSSRRGWWRRSRSSKPELREEPRRRCRRRRSGGVCVRRGLAGRRVWQRDAARRRARAWTGRRSSSSPRRRAWSRRAGPARSTRRGRSCSSASDEPRPRHPVGPLERARRASPRRWARCSSTGPSPRTSRSVATARPRCSTPQGRMVAQAEHIPVHLGRDARGGRRGARSRPAAGRRLRAQRPVHGRDPPPRPDAGLPDGRRGRGARLRGHARAPLRRRRDAPGLDARGLARDLPGGARASRRCGSSRAASWWTDALALLLANVRTPAVRRGDLRAQLAANRLGERRLVELVQRRGRDVVEEAFDEVLAYAERRTREVLRRAAGRRARRRGRDRGRRDARRGHSHPRARGARRRRADASTSRAPPIRSRAT